MRPIGVLILAAVASVAVSSARARWIDFAPRPFENGLYVELFASHEREDNRGGANQSGWTDTFFKEQLTVFSNGYFYHPRFLQYRLSLSGALKQEDFATTEVGHFGWMKGTGLEYDARLLFLPEHSYNLELFALRREPLYMEQSATQHNSVETSNGAQFRYRRKPFFAHAGYLDNTTSSSSQSANVKRLAADGQYFKEYAGGNQLSLNALFNNSWFTGAQGLEGTSRDYGAGGFFDITRARLNASVTKSTSSEDSPLGGQFENDRYAFQEFLTLYLPANFSSDISYRISDNKSTAPETGPGGSGSVELSERTKEFQVDVDQRLYQSLDSRYTFLHNSRTSSAGDSTLTSHALRFAYGKNIPRGRVVAGLNGSRSDTDTQGRIDIVSEAHPGTAVPGSFTLFQQYVDPDSLDVFLPSPLPPFESVHLVENIHYTVASIANTLEISVVTLPPEFVVPGTYALSVSYSLVTADFELRTTTYGLSTSVTLLDNLLTPFFSYATVRSDVLSGTFPGLSLDSTTYTAGLNFLDGPWRARCEYQSLQWEVSPYRSWRAEVQYVGSVTPSTRLYATASYLHRYYPTGTSSRLPDPYTDVTATAYGNIQQDLLSRSLTLSAGASYSRLDGRVWGDSYSLNASLDWKIGKLDLSAGANAYGSNTQGVTTPPYDRHHQYYFVRLRRQFSR